MSSVKVTELLKDQVHQVQTQCQGKFKGLHFIGCYSDLDYRYFNPDLISDTTRPEVVNRCDLRNHETVDNIYDSIHDGIHVSIHNSIHDGIHVSIHNSIHDKIHDTIHDSNS